ncbi:MAG: hypothetical protein U9N55_02780 [candidate division Zixibacteria bacterium]|nr:hypothetical protein [candidate division Zixibacteria bacterium]
MRVLITTFLLLAGLFYGVSSAEEYEIIQLGKGANCKWSPDGQYLSFTSSGGLYVYVVDSGTVRQVTPAENVYYMNKHNYYWDSQNTILFVQKVVHRDSTGVWQTVVIKRITIDGGLEELHSEVSAKRTSRADVGTKRTSLFNKLVQLSNGKVGICRQEVIDIASLRQMLGRSEIDTTAYYATNYSYWITRYLGIEKDTDVWLVYSDGRPYKRVTTNKTYRLTQLSPDGAYIACWIGDTILDLDGNIIGKIESASMGSWFPDSRKLVFNKIVEAHDDIVASDLYIVDMTGEHEVQITDTPDKIELFPVVSPDMTMIAYENYASDANYIEIVDMKEALK